MIECVVNVSEGRDRGILDALARAAGSALLDVHRDPDHHRAVYTVAGSETVRELTRRAVGLIDLRRHSGAHPRFGAVDVVPFAPVDDGDLGAAISARDAFARWAAEELELPCFLYGPERSLPDLRRGAFTEIEPDLGPDRPHPRAGAVAVGARPVLVAYNLWLAEADLERARTLARELRGPAVRALGLRVGDAVQVSMNLVDPASVGPAEVFDRVAASAEVRRAELVGLIPRAVLAVVPAARWHQLDLAEDRTIEARLTARGVS